MRINFILHLLESRNWMANTVSVGFDVVQCEVSFVFMILTRSSEHDKCNARFDPDLFFLFICFIFVLVFLFGCCVFLRPALLRCVVVFNFYFYFF